VSEERTQRLIGELTADLEPVEPFPPLPQSVGAVMLLWAAIAAAVLLFMGLRPQLAGVLAADPAYGGVVLGLLLAGIGGTTAAFSAVVPGRESVRLAALAMAVSGVTVAGVLCMGASDAQASSDPRTDLACMGYSAALSLPLTAFISYRAVRGWVQDPARVAIITLFAAVAMGALVVHLFCPAGASAHFLAAHLGAAPLGALVGALPLSFLLRRATA
jgi:hypothetical protein